MMMIKLFFKICWLLSEGEQNCREVHYKRHFFLMDKCLSVLFSERVGVDCLVLLSEGECVFRKEAEQPPPLDHQQQWWWLGLQPVQSLWLLTSVWSGSYQGQRFTEVDFFWFFCLCVYLNMLYDFVWMTWATITATVSACKFQFVVFGPWRVYHRLKHLSYSLFFHLIFFPKWLNIHTSFNWSNHVGLKLVLWCYKIRIWRLTTDSSFHLGSWPYGRDHGSTAQIPSQTAYSGFSFYHQCKIAMPMSFVFCLYIYMISIDKIR